eukprot:COSAG01_NODE_2357_length_7839_cov_6.117571_6_plen_500_part_00
MSRWRAARRRTASSPSGCARPSSTIARARRTCDSEEIAPPRKRRGAAHEHITAALEEAFESTFFAAESGGAAVALFHTALALEGERSPAEVLRHLEQRSGSDQPRRRASLAQRHRTSGMLATAQESLPPRLVEALRAPAENVRRTPSAPGTNLLFCRKSIATDLPYRSVCEASIGLHAGDAVSANHVAIQYRSRTLEGTDGSAEVTEVLTQPLADATLARVLGKPVNRTAAAQRDHLRLFLNNAALDRFLEAEIDACLLCDDRYGHAHPEHARHAHAHARHTHIRQPFEPVCCGNSRDVCADGPEAQLVRLETRVRLAPNSATTDCLVQPGGPVRLTPLRRRLTAFFKEECVEQVRHQQLAPASSADTPTHRAPLDTPLGAADEGWHEVEGVGEKGAGGGAPWLPAVPYQHGRGGPGLAPRLLPRSGALPLPCLPATSNQLPRVSELRRATNRTSTCSPCSSKAPTTRSSRTCGKVLSTPTSPTPCSAGRCTQARPRPA